MSPAGNSISIPIDNKLIWTPRNFVFSICWNLWCLSYLPGVSELVAKPLESTICYFSAHFLYKFELLPAKTKREVTFTVFVLVFRLWAYLAKLIRFKHLLWLAYMAGCSCVFLLNSDQLEPSSLGGLVDQFFSVGITFFYFYFYVGRDLGWRLEQIWVDV